MRNLEQVTLKQLTYLLALIEEKHVTRAAERLGIGQPAMSTALAKLREVFGDPLLVRTSSGMEATARAVDLARRAHEALAIMSADQHDEASFRPDTAEGHFRIMASSGVSDAVIPLMMEIVRREAPQLRFTVGPGDIRRTAEYLRDGEVDFVLGFVQHAAADLHKMSMYPQRLVGIARKHHPVVRGSLTLQTFVDAGHVVWGAPPVPFPAFENAVSEALENLGHTRNVVLRVASTSSTVAVVAATDLLAVVPEPLARMSAERERIQVLQLPFHVGHANVDMLWHARRHHDPTHRWIRSVLRRIAPSLVASRGPDSHQRLHSLIAPAEPQGN